MAIYRMLLFRWAPLVYLVTALPAAIFAALLTPPFQVPGESGHFLQDVQFLSSDPPPANAVRMAEAFHAMDGHPEVKLDPSVVEPLRALDWTSDAPATSASSSLADDPPVFILPAVIGVGLGRTAGLGVYDSFVAARIVNALAAVLIGTLAIGTALNGRALLFGLLSLPSVFGLAGSLAPDAVLIACVALVVGLCSRAAAQSRPVRVWLRVPMAVLIGAAVASHLAYAPLLILLLTGAVRPMHSRIFPIGFLAAVAPFCIAIAIALGWTLLHGASLSWTAPTPASIKAEIGLLRQQAPVAWQMARTVVVDAGLTPVKAFIGLFGWSDTPLPFGFYVAWIVALALGVLVAFFEEGLGLSFAEGIAMIVCCGLAGLALAVRLSPLFGSPDTPIDAGLLGRSMLPVAMLLVLAIPALAIWRRRLAYSAFGNLVSVVGWWALFVFAPASNWLMMPEILLNRFYL